MFPCRKGSGSGELIAKIDPAGVERVNCTEFTSHAGQVISAGRQSAAGSRSGRMYREWLRRIEAMLFASAARGRGAVDGAGASVDLLIEDLTADLADRPYESVRVGKCWLLRTKPSSADAIRVAADVAGQALNLSDFDLAVQAAIAYQRKQPRSGAALFAAYLPREYYGLQKPDEVSARK